MLSEEYLYYTENPNEWKNSAYTNCYLFALQLDIPFFMINNRSYFIGGITEKNIPLCNEYNYTASLLIKNLYRDLDYLKIDHKIISPNEEGDWKIALFLSKNKELITDFHLLRYYNETWYQKNGFKGGISNTDFSGNIITDPLNCNLLDKEYIVSLKLSKRN